MTPDFSSKFKLLAVELRECAHIGTKEHHLDVINRTISHIESEFGCYFVLLEELKELRAKIDSYDL